MRGRILSSCFVIAVVGLVAPACGSSTTPTTPTPTTVTSTFTGTLTVNGSLTFSFDAASAGTVTATLTTGPDSTLPIGLSIGVVSGQTCAEKVSNDNAFQGSIVTGVLSNATTMCVRINDSAGKMSAPLTFQIDVVHP